MKALGLLVALALVAGCAHNPADDLTQTLLQRSTVTSHPLLLPPEEAAQCVAGNLKAGYDAQTRVARMYQPETFEVQVRRRGELVAGVYVTPIGSASKARTWLKGLNYQRADTVEKILAGC